METICWKRMMLQLVRVLLAVALAAHALPASAATLYVWQSSPSPAPPYASWATAATNIQDAVDAAAAGDLILVTNGFYSTGQRSIPTDGPFGSSRVAITKAVTLRSVNGPQATVISGESTNFVTRVRCVYLTNGAVLEG